MTERQGFPWASPDLWLTNPREARDHNRAAWHAAGRGIGRKISRGADATLHPGGNVDPGPTPEELRARFRAALEDVRRRRLSATAPDGWPVLSLTQESQVCRIVAQLQGTRGAVALDPEDETKETVLSCELDKPLVMLAFKLEDGQWSARPGRPCARSQATRSPSTTRTTKAAWFGSARSTPVDHRTRPARFDGEARDPTRALSASESSPRAPWRKSCCALAHASVCIFACVPHTVQRPFGLSRVGGALFQGLIQGYLRGRGAHVGELHPASKGVDCEYCHDK